MPCKYCGKLSPRERELKGLDPFSGPRCIGWFCEKAPKDMPSVIKKQVVPELIKHPKKPNLSKALKQEIKNLKNKKYQELDQYEIKYNFELVFKCLKKLMKED